MRNVPDSAESTPSRLTGMNESWLSYRVSLLALLFPLAVKRPGPEVPSRRI
jgi:hypothetical protein